MGLTPTPVLPLPPEPKGAAPRSSDCPPRVVKFASTPSTASTPGTNPSNRWKDRGFLRRQQLNRWKQRESHEACGSAPCWSHRHRADQGSLSTHLLPPASDGQEVGDPRRRAPCGVDDRGRCYSPRFRGHRNGYRTPTPGKARTLPFFPACARSSRARRADSSCPLGVRLTLDRGRSGRSIDSPHRLPNSHSPGTPTRCA